MMDLLLMEKWKITGYLSVVKPVIFQSILIQLDLLSKMKFQWHWFLEPNAGIPAVLLAAYNDHPYPGGPGLGVSYSHDGGANWIPLQLQYPFNPYGCPISLICLIQQQQLMEMAIFMLPIYRLIMTGQMDLKVDSMFINQSMVVLPGELR